MEGHFKSFRKENVHNYVCVPIYIYIRKYGAVSTILIIAGKSPDSDALLSI